MADPIISKAAVKPLHSTIEEEAASSPKSGESKFDKVRSRLMDEHAQQVDIPPEIKQVSMEQKKVLEAELSQRLKHNGAGPANQVFSVDMKHAKERIQHLNKRVDAMPKTPAFDPIRQRLASIDAQFQHAGKLMNSVKGTESPADMLKVQMQMYQLTENLELMSKVVEQLTAGMKSILQTPV